MSDFYIVPPRLIVGSLDRSNVVTSLNTLRGDLSFKVNPETGLTLNIASGIFTFSILPDFYVKKSGDTINSNIIFQPSSGNYGLAVGSGTSDPNAGIAGALFYNTNSDVLKVYDGSTWNEIASTGTTGITVSFADNRYLRLDGTNTPTGHISMGSQFLRFANLTTRALAGTAGQVYFNTDTNRLDLYDGSSWVPVGTGITGIFAGAGASVSPNPITNTGTVSVNQSYNFNWTGTHTHNNPITFAPNQQFDASKLTIAYEVAGDILTYSGTAWTRLGKGGPNTLLGVHCCGGDLEYKTLVAGAGILISYQGSSIFLASTGGTGTGSGGSGGSGTGYTFYDKGDLLVGLGDSLYKLPVGPNKRFYLHSNSDTVSGVAWTTTVGMAITSIAPSALVSYYGDLWYNTADGTLNVFYNDVDTSQWVEVVSGGAFSQVYQGVNYGIPFYVSSGTAITSNNNFTNVGTGVSILYTNQSTSTNSGAFVVSGGVGIGGTVFIGGATQIQGTTNVSADGWQSLVGSFGILSRDFKALVDDVTVGSLVNLGGFANVGNAFIGGTTTITNNTPSFSYDTGALVVYGGVGIGGTLFVSPNKASSVSGVKLFNGVVSQATWQGNTVAYNYGGTGYSTFSKGDILVGTGTSLLILSVGTNNQVLAVDSTSATGLTWSNVASNGFATIGITSLNGISLGQQYLNATYSGNTFGFTSLGSTHTLNIPIAGTSTTGLVSTGSQTFSGSKTFSSDTIVTSATDASNISSGALVVSGGAGFGKSVFIGGNLDVAGDMYIRGTMTTINTVNLTVDDKNIEIGSVDTPTDITAEGGGITLKGSTDKTIVWNAGIGWSFNNPVNLSDGNTFKIGNTTVLSSTTLGSSVVNSSLTSVGTLVSGTWNASTISVPYGGTGLTNYTHSAILVGSGSSFIQLLPGTNDQVLTVDNSSASGYKWAFASGLNSNGTLTSINGIGASQQYLTFGYSGTLPNIVSSGSTHTFNIPIAGVGSTGLVSTQAQSFAGNKTFTGSVYITDTTASTSYTSGALVVSGGLGVSNNLYVDKNVHVGNGFTGSLYFERAYMGSAGASQIPYMAFIGQTNLPITLRILPDNTLSYEANYGQILSLSNSSIYDSWIYRINDISGMPLIRASNDGIVALAEYGGSVGIGKSNPSYTLDVLGDVNVAAGYNFLIDGIPISAGAGSSGIYSINGLTNFVQYFNTGTNGSDFNISSVGYTHTFNIPIAGVGKTGLVSSLPQTLGGIKTFSDGLISSSGATIYGNLVLPDNPLAYSYGGTGYTNYAKGDLLVGTGSSLLKLPVGSDNQVLTVDGTTATGLTWSNASGSGTTTIGIPSDNTYTDGFFSTWTSGTPISNAFDDINELLALLAPARPNYLTGTSLVASSVPTYYTVKISAGLGTEWYQAGYGTGSQITSKYYLSGAHTLNTANTSTTFSAGSLTTSTYGTIYFSRYNYLAPTGGGVGTIDLTTNYTVGFTNNNLKLTALGTYNSIWTKANAQILTYTQPNPGYEGVYIAHTENSQLTNTYEMWKDPWSASNGSPIFSQAATASTYSQSDKWLSGISYYATGTGFSVYFKGAAGIYSCAYNVTQVYAISATGLNTSTGLPASPPLFTDELDKSGSNHVRVSLSVASQSSFNKYLTVTIYKAHGTTAASNATISKAINTYGTVSTDTYEGFQDEARRLVIGSGIAFTSTIDMASGNAQVRSGTLQYPLVADYDTQWGGSHTFSGDQEYQRYFYKTSASTGSLTFTGFTASNIAPYGTGSVNALIYLDGDSLWFDLGVLQGSNANDGSTRSAAISAKTSASGGALGWSIGTKTTGVAGAGNSARYRVVIIFRNNTYNMTSITSS